ncbi:mechanosensitive ion channel family protein [Neisseria leonii]|uniref:mechanosensitive ion channel family protein n=1 Tax=Neisseria leonii TaxID=2995413 RepID=UPI00237AE8DD|nr:mechanosensitive ion channel domain-containing protein [Neisseria sp. 3986]MDD9324792.1 mechanosensitive ion channel family protein [Neisseria sp. 3986]
MHDYFIRQLAVWGIGHDTWQANLILAGMVAVCAVLLHLFLHLVLFRFLSNRFARAKSSFLKTLAENRLFTHLAYTIQGVVLNGQLRLWLADSAWRDGLMTLTNCLTLIAALFTLFALLDAVQAYFSRHMAAQHFPLRGLVQSVKLIAAIGIGILLVSLLLGQSPMVLLGSLGAMTAVLMLVFKDPIMGLVAGIQLSANRMLHVGDWLEMPKYNADGAVTDIGLTTVKVQNWDNTVTTIPTYALIADSFKNWRAMSESGGRRIKRPVYIDAASVHFLSSEEIGRLRQSRLLADYLAEREKEVADFNRRHQITSDSRLNGRHLTNLGTFRAYLQHYLQQNPFIRQDMTLMVRQLEADGRGIPLEVYCFTNTVAWGEYEAIQADIFDHIFAVAGEFALQIYQAPSGNDVRSLADSAVWKQPRSANPDA